MTPKGEGRHSCIYICIYLQAVERSTRDLREHILLLPLCLSAPHTIMAVESKHAAKLIVSVMVLWAISATSFILRAVSIQMRKRSWKSHDYLTALALLCFTGYAADVTVGKCVLFTRMPLDDEAC
ncbi:hypothetical protein P170DRAFT_155329 [Aspergillus steynii IBT 23096]|uniref:Uncharacterized protein n=1 Tax=Aspergillus steynii IBT 23096 TaxID=1392250 RepID=A0A2I2GDF3_9EURO|nr:uncharacterized protein P170DRAFT_155329 [Aspergillus steynii IBT 23096]PLB50871.1 hypothetical protein P170DRAFT_155329 [Aspergillus steynii IBT 23096]